MGKGKEKALVKKEAEAGVLSVPQFVDFSSVPTLIGKQKKSNLVFILQTIFIVIIPTVLAVAYYGFVASGRYLSSTQIVIQSAESSPSSGLQGLIGGSVLGGGGLGGSQGDILASYVHSASVLHELEQLLSLREMYAPENVDKFSKLNAEASNEEFLEYYQGMTTVHWDPMSGLIAIEAQAFSAEDSKLILDTIIMLSEEKLNSLTIRKQRDRVTFAREELVLAEKRLYEARLAVTEFRRKYGEIDPARSAEATGGLLAGIQAQLTQERANLSTLLFSMRSDSPMVKSARIRIASLEIQAKQERTNLAGKSGVVLSDLVSEFEGLAIEEEFARAIYTSALAFLENTRASAQQENSYVVDFIAANMPDEATEPQRYIIMFTVFIVSLLVLGTSKLIIAAIKEQAKL